MKDLALLFPNQGVLCIFSLMGYESRKNEFILLTSYMLCRIVPRIQHSPPPPTTTTTTPTTKQTAPGAGDIKGNGASYCLGSNIREGKGSG